MTEPERMDYLIKTLESGVAARFAEKTGMTLPKVSSTMPSSVHIQA